MRSRADRDLRNGVLSDVPSTYSDPELTEELAGYATEVLPDIIGRTNYLVTPSDDFVFIFEQVPSTYFMMEHMSMDVVYNTTIRECFLMKSYFRTEPLFWQLVHLTG